MEQKLSLVFYSANVLLALADLTRSSSYLVCNKGIYLKNKAATGFEVTQEQCYATGTCEGCFKHCSNYTDVILRTKNRDVNGPFNISWTINGEETTYLMRYNLQQPYTIPQTYYTMLHFPVQKIPLEGTYTIILRCRTSSFVRVRVTVLLPPSNRTTHFIKEFSSPKITVSSLSVPLTVKVENDVTKQNPSEEVNAGVMVAVVLGALTAVTLLIVTSVVCMRRAAKNMHSAPDSNVQQVSNNHSTNSGDINSGVNIQSQNVGNVQYLKRFDDSCIRSDFSDTCTKPLSPPELHDTTENPFRRYPSSSEILWKDRDQSDSHGFSASEDVQVGYGYKFRQNSCPGLYNIPHPQATYRGEENQEHSAEQDSNSGQHIPLHLQRALQSINSEDPDT